MTRVRVAAAQVAADVTQAPTTERLVEAVRAAATEGADLVVLPELASSGSCFRDRDEAWAAAEPLDGPTVSALRRVSREVPVTVVAGVALREGPLLSNAAVVVEEGDALGVYRKSHLWSEEKLFFAAADQGPLLVTTRCGVVAVLICYDLEFPELVRIAAEAGADIVTVPANWPVIDHPPDQPAIEVVKAQAVAAYYGVFVVVADRCGDERGTRWVGGTSIIAPSGYLLAGPATEPGETAREAVIWADIDPAAAGDKSLGAYNDRLLDRRELLYGPRS
ncbi:MAG TPA: nitrilase-related carbon-nitrogen hydrolase [Lapillicoccus sp.]